MHTLPTHTYHARTDQVVFFKLGPEPGGYLTWALNTHRQKKHTRLLTHTHTHTHTHTRGLSLSANARATPPLLRDHFWQRLQWGRRWEVHRGNWNLMLRLLTQPESRRTIGLTPVSQPIRAEFEGELFDWRAACVKGRPRRDVMFRDTNLFHLTRRFIDSCQPPRRPPSLWTLGYRGRCEERIWFYFPAWCLTFFRQILRPAATLNPPRYTVTHAMGIIDLKMIT